MVLKEDSGDWKPCGVYSALNSQTVPDWFQLQHIQYSTGNSAGTTIFSKIDVSRADHQIPVATEDITETAARDVLRSIAFR